MIEFVSNPTIARWWHEEDDWNHRPTGYYFFACDRLICCGPYENEAECQEAQARFEDHYP